MGAPELVLRFRNYVNGELGVEAHARIIAKHGSSWWGW